MEIEMVPLGVDPADAPDVPPPAPPEPMHVDPPAPPEVAIVPEDPEIEEISDEEYVSVPLSLVSASSELTLGERAEFASASSTSPLPDRSRHLGGFRAVMFLTAAEALQTSANYGLEPKMAFYLRREYHTSVAMALNIVFYWSTVTSYIPFIGSLIADSYFGRFRSIGIGYLLLLSGMIMFWFTAVFLSLKPRPCIDQICESATGAQYAFLFISYTLMTLAAGLLRPCSLPFIVEQMDRRDQMPAHKVVLESLFRWCYLLKTIAYLVATIGIIYIQVHVGWRLGIGLPVIFIVISTITFFGASPLYIKAEAKTGLLCSFCRVIWVAYRNRRVPFPHLDGGYHHRDAERSTPSERLRCLNKACIIRIPDDVNTDRMTSNRWRLCTVEEVERLKALIRVLPLWSSLIVVAVNRSQTTSPLIDAYTEDIHIGSVSIPASYIPLSASLSKFICVFLFYGVLIPAISKFKGEQVYLGVRIRMGIGLCFSCMAVLTSAIVEHISRTKANNGDRSLSAMWLLPQLCLNGFADSFNEIAHTQFYFQELPRSMASIGSAMFLFGLSVGTMVGNNTYISITEGQYENFETYTWILVIASCTSMLCFLLCSWGYGPCVDERVQNEER